MRRVCVCIAAERPLLWVIEDLHFAAKESRQLALSLARAVEGHRVLLLLTTRPALTEEELAHFSRLENFRRAALGRLSARAVILLLQDAFKSEALADKLGARIALKSDGVPFFVFEMIRGLKEGQFITELPDGSFVESKVIEKIEVPSAVRDLIEVRLRGLAREDRAILDVGAVLGFEFDPHLVARTRGLPRVQALEVLADIERRSGVVRASGSRYRFDHHQIQEVVYADLPHGLKEEYHTLLAEAYGGCIQGEPSGEDHAFLASHHLRGNCPGGGLPHLNPALELLSKANRSDAAIELAARALNVPGLLDSRERTEVLLTKASLHGLRGERETRRTALDEALALADLGKDVALRGKARLFLGNYLTDTSDYASAQEQCEQALDLARETEDRKLEAEAKRCLGTVWWYQGRSAQARAHFERSLGLAREMGDGEVEARAANCLGTVDWSEGRYEEARANHEKHLALSREIGDRLGEAMATGNLGLVFMNLGRHEQARVQIEKHLALSREIGDRLGEAKARSNLGSVFGRQGRYEEARAHIERSLALSREIDYRRGETLATCSLGLVFLNLCRYEEARAHFERSLALSREIGDRSCVAAATGNLGLVFESQGRYEQARAHHEKLLALSREIGDREGEAIATGNLGKVFLLRGRHEQAGALLEKQLALAREIGERRQEGYALYWLASLTDAEGDAERALRLFAEALKLRRELGDKGIVAETLIELGRVELEQGDTKCATTHLDEALTLAQEVKQPATILEATVYRARLPGGDLDAALSALKEHEDRVIHATKMEARFRLWELTKDKTHLAEAKRLLDFAVEQSPEEYRTSMIENVP
ncbi:MAG: ATP-binding protein, partial [Planctomycetota bacterium]